MTTSLHITAAYLTGLFLCVLVSVTGQTPPGGVPEVLNFSKAEYRAGTQVWAAVQDTNEVLYFANNKGVLVFDGTRWQLVEMPNQTVVRALAADTAGGVYVGAQDELGVLHANALGQVSYRSFTSELPPEVDGFEDIWKIFPVNGTVFYCSQRFVLLRRDEQWSIVEPTGRFENCFELNGQIFTQDIGRGLMRWNGTAFELIPGGERFVTGRIAALLPGEQHFLAITESRGIYHCDDNGCTSVMTELSNFLREHKAYCAIALSGGGYAIGTVRNGLIIVDSLGARQLQLNKSSGLQNNTVLSLLQDQQSNLWLGLDNGIDYVRVNGPFSVIRSESGLEGTGYATMAYDGRLFAGTNQGLFVRPLEYEANAGGMPRFRKVPGLTGQVWSIDTLGSELLIGAHEGAYVLRANRVMPLASRTGVWKFLPLSQDPDYALVGTYTGLDLFHQTDAGWTFVEQIAGFRESARIMEQDAYGDIWVSHTYKGLFRLELADDFRTVQTHSYDSDDGLPADISIEVAKVRGETVFTTPGGVYLYERELDRFVEYANFNEVLGGAREINRLLEDANGDVWFSMADAFGMLKVVEDGFLRDKKLARFHFNHIQDRLVDGFEHVYACGKDVYVGTERGLLRFDPQAVPLYDQPFSVLLREVALIAGQDTLAGGEGKQAIMQSTEPYTFRNAENSFRFAYSAPFYQNIGHLEYRYWLEGFSESWSAWSSRTEKEFTNIPPGTYTFHVEAHNAYGTVSQPATFTFSIRSPWYWSSYALVLYLLLAAAAIVALYYLNSRKLEQEKAAINAARKEEIKQKEAVFRKKQQRSEEEIGRLRNENLRADVKHKTAQLASATMHLVQKGEILLRIKKELKSLEEKVQADGKKKIKKLVRVIDSDIKLDNNWQQFEVHFDQVHEDFLKKLREAYPDLTPKDQKLCAYLRMNLTTKEIAPLMNISVRGVEIARYRLRKKLELQTDTNLVDFIMKFR